MSDDMKPCAATPAATLEQHITDPCVPKNEAEWWAYREITHLREELAAEREKTGVSLTVGGGLQVYGTMDAIHRTQQYILLDSRHPVESADVRRSLARALQAAEAERDALRALLREARIIVADEDRPRMDASELVARIEAALNKEGE